jgi:Tol biopolymer transport system component
VRMPATLRLLCSFALVASVLALLAAPPAAASAYPGQNGKILFQSNNGSGGQDYDVYSVDPDGQHLTNLTNGVLAAQGSAVVSPDGRRIAWSDGDHVKVMNLDGSNKHRITTTGPKGDLWERFPSWSPDGSQIVFMGNDFIQEELYTVSGTASSPQVPTQIGELGTTVGSPTWCVGDVIVFSQDMDLWKIQRSSGTFGDPVRLTNSSTEAQGNSYREPSCSPDGGQVAFTVEDNVSHVHVKRMAITGGAQTLVRDEAQHPGWSPDGLSMVVSAVDSGTHHSDVLEFSLANVAGTIHKVVPHLGDDLEPSWGPLALGADVDPDVVDTPDPATVGGNITYDVTLNNHGPGIAPSPTVSVTLPASVSKVSATTPGGTCSGTTTITCNLTNIVKDGQGQMTLVVHSLKKGVAFLTFTGASQAIDDPVPSNDSVRVDTTMNPAGLADGRIFYCANGEGSTSDIWSAEPDGSDPVNITATADLGECNPVVSPDGQFVAFDLGLTIGIVSAHGVGEHELPCDLVSCKQPTWSPDGSQIAMNGLSVDTGHNLYLQPVDGSTFPQAVTSLPEFHGPDNPAWSPDGTHIAYSDGLNLWVFKLGTSTPVKIANGSGGGGAFDEPSWSPYGQWLVATNDSNGGGDVVWRMRADGSEKEEIMSPGSGEDASDPSYSPAGDRIAFVRSGNSIGDAQIWTMNPDGTGLEEQGITAIGGAVTPGWGRAIPPDTTAPAATKPEQSLNTGRQLGSNGTVPVKLSWSATDPDSPVAQFTLKQSKDGGAFTPVLLPSPLTRSTVLLLAPRHSYRFRVQATDGSGNASLPATGPTFDVLLIQENASSIGYHGSWTRQTLSGASGGSVKDSSTKDDTATFHFTGRNWAWVSTYAPNRGKARVTVDGSSFNVDTGLGSAVTRTYVAYMDRTSSGSHSVTIDVLGTSGRPRVDVDAFVVLK